MSPMSQVNVTARMNSAYCERSGIWPQRIAPRDSAPRTSARSTAVTPTMHASTATTWYTLKPIRTIASTK